MVCPLLITYHFIPNCSPESPGSLVKTQPMSLTFTVSDSVSLGWAWDLISNTFPGDATTAALREEPHFENHLQGQVNCFGIPQAHQAHSCLRDFVLALLSAWKALISVILSVRTSLTLLLKITPYSQHSQFSSYLFFKLICLPPPTRQLYEAGLSNLFTAVCTPPRTVSSS